MKRKRYSCSKCHHQHNTSSKICKKHTTYLKTPEKNRLPNIYNNLSEEDIGHIILECRDLDQFQILLDKEMRLFYSEPKGGN